MILKRIGWGLFKKDGDPFDEIFEARSLARQRIGTLAFTFKLFVRPVYAYLPGRLKK